MDFDALEPDAETAEVLRRILADFAADDPDQPWTGGEMRIAVPLGHFPLPELARAALRWAGYVQQNWDDKTAWRLGGRFRDVNVALSSTKYGIRFMVEADPASISRTRPYVHPATADAALTEQVQEPDNSVDINDDRAGEGEDEQVGTVERRGQIDKLLMAMASRKKVPTVFSSTRHDLSDDPDLEAFFKDFLAALGKAARMFDKRVVAKLVKDQVRSGNVTLLNQNARLRGAYNYFRRQAQAFIDGDGGDDVRQQMADMGFLADDGKPGYTFFNPFVVPSEVGYCLTAMATAYFSWLEHVLVLALPFTAWEPEDRSVTAVIGDTWSLKWRRVVPDSPVATVAFDRLKVAVEEFRNLDAHGGFGKKERALFIHTPVGALPARLIEGTGSVRATIIPDTPTGFPEACAVFDATDEFLRTGPLAEAMMWIEADLQVPFDASHREMLKDAMAETHRPFEETVLWHSELIDRRMNFDM